jgi:hypothetical protein
MESVWRHLQVLIRMVRRAILDISRVRTIDFVNSLASDSMENKFLRREQFQGGQRIRWAEMHTSSEGAAMV